MKLKGVELLPINVTEKEAINILTLAADVSQKIGKLSVKISHSLVSDNLIRILSMQESVQSTRIEGTQVTFADVMEKKSVNNPGWEILEVMNYNQALRHGVEMLKNGYPISSRLIKNIHEILMKGARGATNRIGDAVYIPIEAQEISLYMTNLEYFINKEKHISFRTFSEGHTFDETANSLIRVAIMHAQFESIHPFLDGNGRLGRILILLNLISDEVIDKPYFFVSEELEKERARYYDLLNGVRGKTPDWASWIVFFLRACGRMADSLLSKLDTINHLAMEGLKNLDLESHKKIWLLSFSEPVLTVKEIVTITGLSEQTIRKALTKLVELELLYTEKSKDRNRKYRNYDLIRILN